MKNAALPSAVTPPVYLHNRRCNTRVMSERATIIPPKVLSITLPILRPDFAGQSDFQYPRKADRNNLN